MKKRILSLILALSMVLSVLPLGAFAADPPELVMKDGLPDCSNGTSGNGWDYDSSTDTLTLNYGAFDFSSTHPQNKTGTQPAPAVKCAIESGATISGGTFAGSVTNNDTIEKGTFEGKVTNNSTISGGTFQNTGSVTNGNGAAIGGGTFNGTVINNAGGEIADGTFAGSGSVENNTNGTIYNGNFNGTVTNNGTIKNGAFASDKKVENKGTIENGKFTGTVTNSGTIKDGTFAGSVTNNKTISGGTFQNGCSVTNNKTISGGTFQNGCRVTNYGTINGKGTFEGTVVNNATGDITGGTFQSTCSVTNTGIIKDGIFTIKVENGGIGEIFGGIFAAGLSRNDGNVAGGVFNGNATITGVRGLHSITWDTAYPNAKITKVNDVSADWKPYVVIDGDALPEVIITADTEIFSLNGKSIGDGNCKSSYGSGNNIVTFTMPDEDVVLNRTAELEVADGEIESGETAKGSGRVLIGGKVEVTTKDKTQDFVGWTIAPEGIELRHDDGSAVDLTSEQTFSFMPDVSGGKLTLTADYQPFRTSLLMNADGTVNLEHVNHETYDGNETCKGDGWNVFNRGTLILEKWTYDFQYTAPTEKTGTLEAVTCGVLNEGGTIENGVFRNIVLNEVGGTITGGTFAAGLFEMPGTTNGNVTGGVFNGKTGLTNAHHVTVTDGSVLKVNGEDPLKVDETTGAVTTDTAWDLYSYKDTTMTIIASTEIFSLNGQPIDESNYPNKNDKTTVTFTMPDDKDVVLNKAITSTDLVMENGWPKDSNGGKNPCKGDGWEYIKNEPTNGDMLLLTDGLFDFSTIGDGSAVECKVFVGKPTAITGGEFNGKVINNSGILGGTFHGEVDNMGPGRIMNGTFKNSVENKGMIENGAFHDEVKNNGTINDGTFHGKVENNSVINSGTFNGSVDNTTMGRIENGTFNDAVENNGTIEKGTFHGEVKNNGTIENGTFHGAVENNGTINGGVFNGAVTGSGTVSESITGSGTLNGEPITKTEPEPEPEPTTYTVTVIGGTIDGKTSVSAKENDTLTVVLDQNDIPDGMTFDLWSISSSKLSGDINVDYRAEAMTFQMPPEDVTIRAQYRSAEIIEDAAPSPLATAATIAVGGAAAGIVVWQGVSLGVDLYLANALPQGVPVPTDRRALALLLWETAGKPEVALPTLYGDIPTEEIELQKATRWAVQNGLMDAADKKDASFFDPDHYVTKMDVFGAWLRLKKLLGTT